MQSRYSMDLLFNNCNLRKDGRTMIQLRRGGVGGKVTWDKFKSKNGQAWIHWDSSLFKFHAQ